MFLKNTLIFMTLLLCVFGKDKDVRRSKNNTRSSGYLASGESVEKFVETLMESEKYLKMIEAVEKKVDHLDSNFHENTNSIMKYMSEMLRIVKNSPVELLEKALGDIHKDLGRLKQTISTRLDEQIMRARARLKMRCAILLVSTVSVISCVVAREKGSPPKNAISDQSLWKEEYENELMKAMLSTKIKGNSTRHALSTVNNDAIVDKLLDSISSSEKYLKKVDSIDFRLNRLDIEVHEKSNAIMNRLSDVMKALREHSYADKLEAALDAMKTDVSQLKLSLDKISNVGDIASEYHSDSATSSRLSVIESHMKAMMTALDSIVTTMSEVKTRQLSRAHLKAADTVGSSEPMSMVNEFRKMLHEQRLRKCECKNGGSGLRVDRSERYPTDCHEIQFQGFNVSGIYKIRPDDMEPFYILCDFTTSGGGWTVFQNRYDGSQDFYRGWSDYKYGFGNLAGEFWLGLEKLHHLTNQKLYELRVEVEALHDKDAFAGYSVFTLGPEHEGYRISTLGTYYGNAGDSLSYHAGQKFSTPDEDNDEWKDGSCASEHGGAWWYKECDKSNLNGKYTTVVDENKGQSMYWISFKGPNTPLSKTKMMIRPLPATRPIDFSDNRKTVEGSKLRPILEKPKGIRTKEIKGHHNQPYRFEDGRHDFFPNYA